MKHLLLACLALAGCAVDDLDTSETTDDVQSTNRLSTNALSANRLSTNRLSTNGLASAASAATLTALVSTPEGRELLTYLVGCALPATETITATDNLGVPWLFAGAIGLAPTWYASPPTVSDRRWVSACLLARTNAFGVTVPISMRGTNPALAVTNAERSTYMKFEGAFFGDLWAPDPRPMFTCESQIASTDPSTSSFPLRKCSDGDVIGAPTPCGFTYIGLCEAHCTIKNNAPSCTDTTGVAWPEVIQTYLIK